MLIQTEVKKSSSEFVQYNLKWSKHSSPLSIEKDMIAHGGQWTKKDGTSAGNGLYFHFRRFQEIAWPGRIWQCGPFVNHWAEKCLEVYLNYKYIGVMGCAASGKSDSFGCNVLTDWYAHSECTTGLVTSTDRDSLEIRIWGMIKKYHKLIKREFPWIPGHLIEGRQRLVADARNEFTEGRDFKNGIMGVACKKGNQYVGLGSMIGIHNKRVRMIADECNLMPRAFLDASANLSKCDDFKLVGLGNPNETTNAHGVLCEPAQSLGGWEGGIDQTPGTKTWPTRFPDGVCLQLPGSDSPNLKADLGIPTPFPFLITRQQMVDDAQIWGVDDWHYTMMNEAKMPRGQGSRRVLTKQTCQKFGAFNIPNWRDSRITKIGFLDAAYRGVGGDRCIFGELWYGAETEQHSVPLNNIELAALVVQQQNNRNAKHILALIDVVNVPITAEKDSESAEDQIVNFVRDNLQRRGIEHTNFYYDAGMRTTLVSAFARHNMIYTNTIDCGGKPSELMVSSEIQKPCHEYYSKRITEMWFSVRMVVESGQFRGMREDVCTEFSQREWKMVSGNRIEVEPKEEMKIKTGRSPDLADAVAVGVYGARQKGFIIQKLHTPARMVRQDQWKRELQEKSRKLWRSGALTHSD